MTSLSPSLATALSNTRRLVSSGLPHQAKPAQLLVAIESAIESSSTSSSGISPTAYFASLLQCLTKASADEVPGGQDEDLAEMENMGQGALIPAVLYLLALIIPETPSAVILSKVSPLLDCLLPLYITAAPHPPALKSLLQINTSVLLVAPPTLLGSSPQMKKSWAYMLDFSIDPRPKVRHLAQEGVRKVLTTPVPPKLQPGNHPYLPRAREFVTRVLEEECSNVSAPGASKKKKARFADAEDDEGKRGIWVVQGLRGWAAVWGEDHLSALCDQLLSLPPNPHLTSQVYSLLAHLLSPPPLAATGPTPTVLANLPRIIDSLLSAPPSLTSPSSDIPAYLSALTSALIKMSFQDPLSLSSYLPRAWTLIFHQILLSPNTLSSVCRAAVDSLGAQGLIRYCISDEMILAAVSYHRQGSDQPGARKKQKTPWIIKIIGALEESFDSNALKMGYLLQLLSALISRLRLRTAPGTEASVDESGRGLTAAEELLGSMIQDVGDLRIQKGFEAKDGVDEVVGIAIRVIGVEGVLRVLPLNIEPDAKGQTPQPGRAHLLPLIRANVSNDSLAFFASYFRPLSERVFERKVTAEEEGRTTQGKIWETIVGQIWDCFPGFCEMPRDMSQGLTPPFLGLLTNLLYSQPLLLPSLLRGLSLLVSSTQTLAASTTAPDELRKQFGIDQESAQENLVFLKTLAKDMVSVLLNVFSKLPRDQRGMVGEVIGLWAGILTPEDLLATYNTVTTHLSTNLSSTTPPVPGASPISHTMLDLLIIFVPNLAKAQSTALWTATSMPTMLEHPDPTVQKKSYRLLKRLLEGGKLEVEGDGEKMEEFVRRVGEVAGGVGPGAQRDRLELLAAVVEALPTDRLHLIPELLSEAVLGTKEVNEKARDAGFELLVVMGQKMAKGGIVRQVADAGGEEAEANVEEYITMVAAGLTGATPHMISASINALSRLLFEFKDDVSEETISELVSTLVIFISSKNREIVKSALGFVKVAVVALPTEAVLPHLHDLVPALLGWVHDHKNHFKTKTIHIFERMIRKFGYDEVIRHAPIEGGERKVLENIRKRKERAKKKKARAEEEGDEDEEDGAPAVSKSTSGNAFDDILYNSDSDLSDDGSDEDGPHGKGARPIKGMGKGRKGDKGAAYIRNEGDQPMDLLSRSIAGGVATSDPSQARKRRQPGQDASHFAMDKMGKMVITDEDSTPFPRKGANAGASANADEAAGAGTAFIAAQRGVHGMGRDASGNLRFNKNNKRTRGEEREDEIMDLDDLLPPSSARGGARAGGAQPEKKKKKQALGRLGDEFRAKRAAGDVKRNDGPDPYSYVSLSQAAKRKGMSGRVNLTNKKKGSRA